MSAYYYYCNLDKLEFFSVGVCGGAIKYAGVGRGPTARLLATLFVPPPEGSSRLLDWVGDRFAVLADDHPVPRTLGLPPSFLEYDEVGALLRAHFRDVSDDALRTMILVEPEELESAAQRQDSVFEKLGTLANNGDTAVETWLRRTFGHDWRKDHARRLR